MRGVSTSAPPFQAKGVDPTLRLLVATYLTASTTTTYTDTEWVMKKVEPSPYGL